MIVSKSFSSHFVKSRQDHFRGLTLIALYSENCNCIFRNLNETVKAHLEESN